MNEVLVQMPRMLGHRLIPSPAYGNEIDHGEVLRAFAQTHAPGMRAMLPATDNQ